MKDKFLLFVIGVLVGTIISTGAFYVYTKTINNCNDNGNNKMEMRGGNPPSMQDGDNKEPPARPGENNTQNNNDTQNDSQTNNN